VYKVDLSFVEKDLSKIPWYIREKVHEWVHAVEYEGLEETRKIPGRHDEPLKGKLAGLRSVRLNQAYRLIYKLERGSIIHVIVIVIVIVIEVNKHDY
jgi:proteic killer suppression protein